MGILGFAIRSLDDSQQRLFVVSFLSEIKKSLSCTLKQDGCMSSLLLLGGEGEYGPPGPRTISPSLQGGGIGLFRASCLRGGPATIFTEVQFLQHLGNVLCRLRYETLGFVQFSRRLMHARYKCGEIPVPFGNIGC